MKTIRDLAHLIAGFTFAYCIGNSTGVFDFDIGSKIAWVIFFGTIFGGGAGVVWEYGNKVIFQIEIDEKDILRTVIGSLAGATLAVIYKNLNIISDYMLWGCIILIFLDFIRAVIIKNKKTKS